MTDDEDEAWASETDEDENTNGDEENNDNKQISKLSYLHFASLQLSSSNV